MNLLRSASCVIVALSTAHLSFRDDKVIPWDMGRLSRAPKVFPAEGLASAEIGRGLTPLFFQGEPYQGKETRVFAWYGAPSTGKGRHPAMVLVHGGGGTAYADWVRLWNDRGYAAIALDMLWVSGTSDDVYYLPALKKSYLSPRSAPTLCIRVRMGHSHVQGWAPEEIYRFVGSVLRQEPSLVRITAQGRDAARAWVTYSDSHCPVKAVEFNYTTDGGAWSKRSWHKRSVPFAPQSRKVEAVGEGLNHYRAAALSSPAPKRACALREVLIPEQIQRMLLSDHAILEFEDLRLQQAAEEDPQKAAAILDQMEAILREEIARTELSLLAATRDSRLGFQFECDYVYTPYSLREKLAVLRETLERQLPARRKEIGARKH